MWLLRSCLTWSKLPDAVRPDARPDVPRDIVEKVLLLLLVQISPAETSTVRLVSRLAKSVVDSHTQMDEASFFLLGLTRTVSLLPRWATVTLRTTTDDEWTRSAAEVFESLRGRTSSASALERVTSVRVRWRSGPELDAEIEIALRDRWRKLQLTSWWREARARHQDLSVSVVSAGMSVRMNIDETIWESWDLYIR